MKILCFKFHQNRPINEEFDFFEERRGGRDPRGVGIERVREFINFYLNYSSSIRKCLKIGDFWGYIRTVSAVGFGCGFGPPFCIGLFQIFEIGPPPISKI